MPSVSNLLAIDAGIDRDVDAMAEAFQRAIDRSLGGWYREVMGEVGRLRSTAGALDRRQTAWARKIAVSMVQGVNAGPADTVTRHLRSMTRLTGGVARGLQEMGVDPNLSKAHLAALDRFYAARRADLVQRLVRVARDASTVVTRGVFTSQQVGEVASEIREVVDAASDQLRTLFDTSLMEYTQMVTAGAAQPSDAFLYSGPIDARIRPFCASKVARVWTRDVIDQMDNRQLPNTFLTRGGYNCRHQWRPVREPALVALANTGKVVGGMERVIETAIRAGKVGPRRRTA